MMTAPVRGSAVISEDGRYRYRLDRWWDDTARLAFLMLNPSTADASLNDPTIRRCMRFARREGAGGITVVNLGAYRTSDPGDWCRAADPFGPDNGIHVVEVASTAADLVAAWGAHPGGRVASKAYLELLARFGIPVLCLGTTKSGAPRHPLYVRADQPLVGFAPPDLPTT